jgi:ATP-binding cassette subfamily F protein 3
MVFISHDRYFINRLATKVVEVAGGRLTTHPGNYDDYRAVVDRPPAPAPTPARAPAAAPAAPAAPPPARRRARVDPAVRELRRRVEEIERQIHALEDRLRELGEALGDPALYADGERVRAVAAERRQAEEQVAWLMHEWEELSTALAAHE